MKIAIDAMGGDLGPVATVNATLDVLEEHPELEIVLVGQAEGLSVALPNPPANLTIHPAQDIIRMDELPARALRYGKGTSLWETIKLVKEQKADACVSSGNTGALMAIGRHVLGMVSGIKRPAICTALPTYETPTYMLDLGANVKFDAHQLVQFAQMGVAFVQHLHGKNYPSVALLNIGTEPNKGTEVLKQTAQMIQSAGLNYQGFIEPTTLHDGEVDVVVTDGFTGNIALKAIEGSARYVMNSLEHVLDDAMLERLGEQGLDKTLGEQLMRTDPRFHNGASLLGVNGVVVKSHGDADAYAFKQAILFAKNQVEKQVLQVMPECVSPSERPLYS